MPWSNVSEESVLLTPTGWVRAGSAPSALECFGIDRHGQVVPAVVRLATTGARSSEVFIGTVAAFATFIEETRLLASDGQVVQIGSLVQSGGIGELSFETLLRLPDTCPAILGIDETWMAIVGHAAFTKGRKIALRCCEARDNTGAFPQTVNDGNLTYCLVEYDDLKRRLMAKGCEAICQLGARWLHNDAEMRDEIERSANQFTSLYLTARHHSEKWYRLSYDSLQHTAYVYVSDTPGKPPPVDKGSCAFLGPGQPLTVALSWEGKSWSLLSGGFVVAGG